MESGLWKLRQNGPTFFQVLIRELAPKSKGQKTRLPWTGLSRNYWRNTDVNPTWECKGLNREVAPEAGSGEPGRWGEPQRQGESSFQKHRSGESARAPCVRWRLNLLPCLPLWP